MLVKNERLESADIYRGIGIVFMVMAHIGFGQVFDHFVHAFHMPMFFLLSGFFFKMRSFGAFFTSKIKSLIVPFLGYSIGTYVVWSLKVSKPESSLGYILVFMNSSGFIAGALWFLTALFFANVIYYTLRRELKSALSLHVAVFLVALIGNLIPLFSHHPIPFALDSAAVGVGFLHLGYLFKGAETSIRERIRIPISMLIIVGFMIFTGLNFVNPAVNMRTGTYGVIPLFWLNATGMSLVIWLFSSGIDNPLEKRRILNQVSRLLKLVGKESLIFLCLNQVVIYLWFVLFPAQPGNFISLVLHNLLILVLVLATLCVIAFLWKTIKAKRKS